MIPDVIETSHSRTLFVVSSAGHLAVAIIIVALAIFWIGVASKRHSVVLQRLGAAGVVIGSSALLGLAGAATVTTSASCALASCTYGTDTSSGFGLWLATAELCVALISATAWLIGAFVHQRTLLSWSRKTLVVSSLACVSTAVTGVLVLLQAGGL